MLISNSKELSRLAKDFLFPIEESQDELRNWLREKHQMIISVLPFRNWEESSDITWYYSCVDLTDLAMNDDILCNEDDLGASEEIYSTYDEAFEAGLIYGLNLLNKKQ